MMGQGMPERWTNRAAGVDGWMGQHSTHGLGDHREPGALVPLLVPFSAPLPTGRKEVGR